MSSRKEALSLLQGGAIQDRRQSNRNTVTFLILSHALVAIAGLAAGGAMGYPIGKDAGAFGAEQMHRASIIYDHMQAHHAEQGKLGAS